MRKIAAVASWRLGEERSHRATFHNQELRMNIKRHLIALERSSSASNRTSASVYQLATTSTLHSIIGAAGAIAGLYGISIGETTASDGGNSVVRVTVGLDVGDGVGENDRGGDYPIVTGLNDNLEVAGQSDQTLSVLYDINDGSGVNLEIGQPDEWNGQQIPYINVHATATASVWRP